MLFVLALTSVAFRRLLIPGHHFLPQSLLAVLGDNHLAGAPIDTWLLDGVITLLATVLIYISVGRDQTFIPLRRLVVMTDRFFQSLVFEKGALPVLPGEGNACTRGCLFGFGTARHMEGTVPWRACRCPILRRHVHGLADDHLKVLSLLDDVTRFRHAELRIQILGIGDLDLLLDHACLQAACNILIGGYSLLFLVWYLVSDLSTTVVSHQ